MSILKRIGLLAAAITLCIMPLKLLAFKQNLSGTWYHNGKPTYIKVVRHNKVHLENEDGSRSIGYEVGHNRIRAVDWGVIGTIQTDARNGQRIFWSNGTVWNSKRPGSSIRIGKHPLRQRLSGRWFHNGHPTWFHVSRNGKSFTITNEQGENSSGFFEGHKSLFIPSLNIRGRVNTMGDKIRWSNNTVWRR